jgi:ketosteroid isomerase-like protein
MKTALLFLGLYVTVVIKVQAQSKDEIEIQQLLTRQSAAWNEGDITGFMQGYWQNDSLMFIGKSGITYGWNNTLDNYKKGYPDTTAMGRLQFDIIEMKRLSAIYFFVVGKWHLARSIGDTGGHFSLLFRKIKGRWLIVRDHSS